MSETASENRGGYIGQAWLVVLLALAYGAALAGVETTLAPKIAENKRNETYDQIPSLVEGADKAKTEEVLLADAEGKPLGPVYRAVGADGAALGWVLPAVGQGFADRIELLIGLDDSLSTITGLYVLDQKETPGLGNFIAEAPFQDQFAGKSAEEPLVVVKTDPAGGSNEIRALTGATISSESVAEIVDGTIARLRGPIGQLATGRGAPATETGPEPEKDTP